MKTFLTTFSAIIVLAVTMPSPVNGQEDGESSCSIENLTSEYSQRVLEVQTFEELQQVQIDLGAAIISCWPTYQPTDIEPDGNGFQAQGDRNQIVGPMTFEPGIYVFDYFTTNQDGPYTHLEIDFEGPSAAPYILEGRKTGDLFGRQLVSLGGEYFANIDSTGPWAFSILPFDAAAKTDTPAIASSKVADFVGPFDLQGGFYTLEYEAALDPQSMWGSGHFYIHIRSDDLSMVKGTSEDVHGPVQGQEIYSIESGTYLLEVESDGVSEWSAKLSPVDSGAQ